MSDDTALGYETGHAPTSTDFTYANMYASFKTAKEVCASKPDEWQWIDAPCAFPCPDIKGGCECGQCVFTKTGCKNYSNFPYFDCKRKTVPCDVDGKTQCDVCDYSPILDGKKHAANGPYLTEATKKEYSAKDLHNCYPGDAKYITPENAKKYNVSCQPPSLKKPYTVNGKPVKCRPDVDGTATSTQCNFALGGYCSQTSTDPAQPDGYCMEYDHPYTEWREDFKMWTDSVPRGACTAEIADYRRWCEMPWTRPKTNGDTDDLSVDMDSRIHAGWKAKWHPPFYYDWDSGSCYMTKSYCKHGPEKGGMAQGFGKGKDYFIVKACDEGNKKNEVHKGFDCCTGTWASLAEAFFGRTLPADFNAMLKGDISFSDFIHDSRYGFPLVNFLSDPALKTDKEIFARDYVAPGVHLYLFTWTPEATRLYGLQGRRAGMMASEIATLFPESVSRNEHGHLYFTMDFPRLQDPIYRTVALAMKYE